MWKLKFWTDHTWPPASTASTESFVFLPSTVWISEASVISACSHRNTNASKAIYCAGKWGQFLSCYLFVWSGTSQPGLCRTKQNSKSWRKNLIRRYFTWWLTVEEVGLGHYSGRSFSLSVFTQELQDEQKHTKKNNGGHDTVCLTVNMSHLLLLWI